MFGLNARAAQLDNAMKVVLEITDTEIHAAEALVTEMIRLRSYNPKSFQAAMLLVMSTLLSAGDQHVGTSAQDMTAKLERMIALQKQVGELVAKEREAQMSELLSVLGAAENDELPKEKLN